MIVVDASVLADAFMDDGDIGSVSRRQLSLDSRWVAPEHFWLEVISALRGLARSGPDQARRAGGALAAIGSFDLELVATLPLAPRIWELRDNVTTYDAAYVAVAESRDCPLLTSDRRLARAVGPRCEFVVV